jgi:5-methylcytosine-specific restriction endonuclease McrA
MTRAYIRLDPQFDERKEAYPDGPYRALVACFCLAESQPVRGRFRSVDFLKRILGRSGRYVPYLLQENDLTVLDDGRVYVVGWDEWQEGDWKVGERVRRIRARDRSAGAKRTANWRTRTKVFERDRFTCRYCGVSDYPREWLVLEHVIPVTKGGETTEENLVTACRSCNHRKGNKTPDEAEMPLRDVPRDASPITSLRNSGGSGGGGAEALTPDRVGLTSLREIIR